MAQLTISDAARVTGVSRVTWHRYNKAGKLSRSTDGTIDTAELLRIRFVLQPDTVLQSVAIQRDVTPSATLPVTSPDTATLQQLITGLQRELDAAHAREEAARERAARLADPGKFESERLCSYNRGATWVTWGADIFVVFYSGDHDDADP